MFSYVNAVQAAICFVLSMVFTFSYGATNTVVNLHDITSLIDLANNLSHQR